MWGFRPWGYEPHHFDLTRASRVKMVGDLGVQPSTSGSQNRPHSPRVIPVVPRTRVELVPHGLKGQRSPPSQQGICRGELRFQPVFHSCLPEGGSGSGPPGDRTQHLPIKSRGLRHWRKRPSENGEADGARTRYLRADNAAYSHQYFGSTMGCLTRLELANFRDHNPVHRPLLLQTHAPRRTRTGSLRLRRAALIHLSFGCLKIRDALPCGCYTARRQRAQISEPPEDLEGFAFN